MSVIGTELKVNINVEPIDNVHLSQCDFTCTFFVNPNKSVILKKEDLIPLDDDNYMALLNSEDLGVGTIKMTIKILVPDNNFKDGTRTEIETICTDINITR